MTESDKYKHELADKLGSLISKEGLTDVTDWIEKNANPDYTHNGVARSVAYILEATGDFQREELQDKTRFYVKRLPKRTLEQRHPTLFKLGLILLGAALTLTTGILINKTKKEAPITYKVEDHRTNALYDSIADLRKELNTVQDSLNKRPLWHSFPTSGSWLTKRKRFTKMVCESRTMAEKHGISAPARAFANFK